MSPYRLTSDIWLWLDPSQACNIACALCYTRPSQRQRFLRVEDAQRYCDIIVRSGVTVREITLNWRGEPLLNKAFPEIMRIVTAAFPDTRVQFHTNAMALTPRLSERLCAIDRPFHVYLSIDGGSKVSHERNRGRETFDKAVAGGTNLLHARGSARWPHVTLYQLDLGVAETSYDPAFLDLANRCDVWQRVYPIGHDGSSDVAVAADRSRDGFDPVEVWDRDAVGAQPKGACFWAGYSLSVAPDGEVSVCILNQLADREGVLGNLNHQPMAEILVNAADFRERLERAGRANVQHCAACAKIDGVPRPPRPVDDLKRTLDHLEWARS